MQFLEGLLNFMIGAGILYLLAPFILFIIAIIIILCVVF